MHWFARINTATLFVLCAGVHPLSARAAPQPSVEQGFATLEHEYVVYVLGRFPVVATYLGGTAFDAQLRDIDGKLRDYSVAALKQEQAQLSRYRERFTAQAADGLAGRRRIDRSVALAQIEFMLHEQQVRVQQQRSLDSYLDEPFRGIDWQIQGMTATGPTTYGTDAEWRAVLARTQAVSAYLRTAESQLGAGVTVKNTPDWRMLSEGLQTAAADAEYFSHTLTRLASQEIGSDRHDALVGDLQRAGSDAAAAYEHLREFLVSTFFDDPANKDVTALKAAYRANHFQLGESEYNWALRNNLRLDIGAGDLFTHAWPLVLQTRASMVSLAHEIAVNDRWPASGDGPATVRMVFERLTHDAPRDDTQMVEGYRRTGRRLMAYVRDTGLFDAPPDYRLEITVTPEPLRNAIDGAAYYPAPPFKETGTGRFYVTPTGNDPVRLGQLHNFAAMGVLAAHEGAPGHDLHYTIMTRNRDRISPIRWITPGAVEDSSSMWQDSMAVEGWALYSEALLAEPQAGAPHGFYSPEERLYQMRGALLRNLRVRIDTGIHTGRLTFDDAVDLLSENVDFLPGSCRDSASLKSESKQASCGAARRAVARYARWPTQAITYQVGKEQILALRQLAQHELGSDFSLKVFHLTFMTEGTIPAAYFAEELIKSLKYEN
jgi:uncharacterized protein (DUF885 family)